MSTIDISKLDKAEVLVALFNRAKPQGQGFTHYKNRPLTKEIAKNYLKHNKDHNIDYVEGRVLKVDLTHNKIDVWLYNRDNGASAAEEALAPLFKALSETENQT